MEMAVRRVPSQPSHFYKEYSKKETTSESSGHKVDPLGGTEEVEGGFF